MTVEDLLGLSEGRLLVFDYPVERSVELLVNGTRKFTAQVVSTGKRRACMIEQIRRSVNQGRINGDADGSAEASGPE